MNIWQCNKCGRKTSSGISKCPVCDPEGYNKASGTTLQATGQIDDVPEYVTTKEGKPILVGIKKVAKYVRVPVE